MYDVTAFQRLLAKEGLESTIIYLTSADLPDSIKNELTRAKILVGGYPNLSLISSLV